MNAIRWKDDLGSPQDPKEYRVKELGMVIVLQKDIDEATRIGDNLVVELINVTTVQDRVDTYRIGRFIPA